MKSIFFTLLLTSFSCFAQQDIIQLWPESAPGQSEPKLPALVSKNNSGGVTRLSKVTDPSLTIYQPDEAVKNGAAIIICPGGGYNILAVDKEGYEIGEWLSQLGYTAFVLQYRVPKNKLGALQDAQRALRTVRSMSERFNIDKVGIMGFSAGGSLSARAATRYSETLYPATDEIDEISARPNFSILIYPAYLDQGNDKSLTPELKITQQTPPMFLFVATDDSFANSSLVMASALQKSKSPYELHITPSGGHGYGMRSGNPAAETWPALCQKWLSKEILKVSPGN